MAKTTAISFFSTQKKSFGQQFENVGFQSILFAALGADTLYHIVAAVCLEAFEQGHFGHRCLQTEGGFAAFAIEMQVLVVVVVVVKNNLNLLIFANTMFANTHKKTIWTIFDAISINTTC